MLECWLLYKIGQPLTRSESRRLGQSDQQLDSDRERLRRERKMPPSTVALLTVLGLVVASQLCLAASEESRPMDGRSLCLNNRGLIVTLEEDNSMRPLPPPYSVESILKVPLCSTLPGKRRHASSFSYLENIRQRPIESDVRNTITKSTTTKL